MTSRFSSPLPALGVVAAIGALAWVGCGPGDGERYYCDGDGCYSCDAYGCTSVPPPTTQACTGSASCAGGQVCTDSGCATTCSDDASCPKGTVCKSGVCSAPKTDPGKPKECTTKTDCTGGKVCVANVCQACGGSAGPCPCAAASDCGSDQTCKAGACTAQKNTCSFSSECPNGKVCADGQCLAGCSDAAPCAQGSSCQKGVCQPTPGGPACVGDAQCSGATPKCVSGSCTATCTSDGACGAGKFCDQGACVVDTRPQPNCSADAECAGGGSPRKCVGGFCKYTCSTTQGDAYCRQIDSRIGYCAKDGVCRTQTEAQAACTSKPDCSATQSCIDNQCK